MIIRRLEVTMFASNCYILAQDKGGDALVIDPGGEFRRIKQTLSMDELKVKYIVNTHNHIDHIGASGRLAEDTGAPVFMHEIDIKSQDSAFKVFGIRLDKPFFPKDPQPLVEGNIIELEKMKFKVLHTPGHTKGHICLLYEDKVFSGDLIFAGSIGRTDFPGGSYEELINSVKTKIFTLPDNTIIFPGHGPATTVGEEKRSNPFFVGTL